MRGYGIRPCHTLMLFAYNNRAGFRVSPGESYPHVASQFLNQNKSLYAQKRQQVVVGARLFPSVFGSLSSIATALCSVVASSPVKRNVSSPLLTPSRSLCLPSIWDADRTMMPISRASNKKRMEERLPSLSRQSILDSLADTARSPQLHKNKVRYE